MKASPASKSPFGKKESQLVIDTLNRVLELELAGVVRYMHYSFMIFGHSRIPIVAWLRDQANESTAHAVLAGEHITSLGGHPSSKMSLMLCLCVSSKLPILSEG